MKNTNLYRLVFAALFTAITAVFTMVIRIPSPGTGYINIGDTAVLLSAWMIGGWYGALAAGMGSALADLLSGYAAYVPGTFLIKFLMAFAAWALYRLLTKARIPAFLSHITAGLAAEGIMLLGYLVFEMFFLGYGAAAVPAAVGNAVQGITNLILALILSSALESVKVLKPLTQH